jgi:hypothetical protein
MDQTGMYIFSGQTLLSQQNQHKGKSDHKKNNDGQNAKTHASGNGLDNPKTEGSSDRGQLFHYIIKAEKGGMIAGFRQHLGIGGPGKGLCATHYQSNHDGNQNEANSCGDEINSNTYKYPDND